MAKHISEEERAGVFINALLDRDHKVNVEKVENGRVLFSSLSQDTVEFLQNILQLPERLSGFVYHAIANTPEVIEHKASNSLHSSQIILPEETKRHPLIEALNWNIDAILAHIFTPRMIENFALLGYNAENGYEVVENHNKQRSLASARRLEAGYELIQLAFSNHEQILRILDGRSDPINSEDDIEAEETTSIGRNIIKISTRGKSVDTAFNIALFKRMLQDYIPELAEEAPIIVQVSNNSYSVDLDHLKKYIGKYVSELIFTPELSDIGLSYRPIGIPLENGEFAQILDTRIELNAEAKALFHIAIDVSSSMRGSLNTCVAKLNLLLDAITASTDAWEIILTTFSTQSESISFNSDDHTADTLKRHLTTCYANGLTRLYGTIEDVFGNIINNHSTYSSVAVMLFTDGVSSGENISPERVVQSTTIARENVRNLQIFTVELGDSNRDFFTQLATNSGCTYVKLSNMHDFEQLLQYADSLTANSHVLSFLNDALEKHRLVMAEGEISVGANTLLNTDSFTIDGKQYNISDPIYTADNILETKQPINPELLSSLSPIIGNDSIIGLIEDYWGGVE